MQCINGNLMTLVLVSFFSLIAYSQEASFAFAYNTEGKAVSLDSESSNSFGYKYENAQMVLDKLVQTKGTPNMPAPTLVMNNAEQKPAWIDLHSGKIYLEEKAYEICRQFGKDSLSAVAILLSHELIHYYEKHNWENHFLQLYGDNLNELDEQEWADQLKLELQADQLGGFLANMAGFKTTGLIEALLTEIYKGYNLVNQSGVHHYPSLSERIQLGLEGEKQLSLMNEAFEMATLLSMAGEYEQAYKHLDHIIIKSNFQSREIHNNKGVLMALSALSYFRENEMPFIIPLEIDVNSRLSRKVSNITKRTEYLKQAEASLKTAIAMDEGYFPAYVNLASVYILQENHFEAEYLCRKILKNAEADQYSTEISNANMNLGIMAFLEKDKEAAQNYFQKAQKFGHKNIVAYNLNVLEQKDIRIKEKSAHIETKIDGLDLDQLYARIMRDEEKPESHIQISKSIDFYTIQKSKSKIFVCLENYGDDGYYFFQRGKRIETDAHSFDVNATQQEVEALYGNAEFSVLTSTGSIQSYNNSTLFIKYDDDDVIEEFIVYHRSK